MRVSNVGNARPLYYDRNPLPIAVMYLNTLSAPVATTTVSTYTVPVNRKAFVGYVQASVLRESQSSDAMEVNLVVTVQTPPNPKLYLLNNVFANLIPHTGAFMYASSNIELNAGDVVTIIIADANANGSIQYNGAVHIIEFDA